MRASAAGGFGPHDPKGSQELRHQHRPNRLSSATRPAVRRTVKAQPIRSIRDNSSLPAKSATSPDELQPAARGGDELHGSKSRKSTANNSAQTTTQNSALFAVQHSPPILTDSACRPSLRSRYAAWANRPAPLRVAEAPHPFTAPFSEVRPRRASPAPLMRRCARERRFYESRYSLSAYSSPPRGVAANCMTLKGRKSTTNTSTQRSSPIRSSKLAPNLSGSGCALPGWAEGPARKPGGSTNRKSTSNSSAQIQAPCSARRGSKTVAGFRARRTSTAQPTAQSKAQFSVPCPPHCGSAFAPPRFRAPCAIHLYSATAEIVESLLQAAARGFTNRRRLPSGRAGPTSRGRAKLTFRYGSLSPNPKAASTHASQQPQ